MNKIFFSAGLVGIIFLSSECKESDKAELPSLTTNAISNIKVNTATSGGNISFDGDADITVRGVAWSTSSNPTTADSHTSDGSGIGQFESNLTLLTPGTLYYVRAYATNSAGTAYGNEVSFTSGTARETLITTTPVTQIAGTTAVSGGNITDDGGSDITARGVAWGISHGATIDGAHTMDGNGVGIFVSNLTGLTAGSVYYVRAYATNATTTTYGNEVTFTASTGQGEGNLSVNIKEMAYTPATITVPVNTTITWTNNDTMAHTVTSDSPLFDSGNMNSGGTYSFTFTTAGSFPYHCSYHPAMTATVIVQ